MDEAMLRRGAASANARWDNSVAILSGDFLFARVSGILADLGPEAVRIQAVTFERLCIGQIKETVGPKPGEDAVKHHLEVLADKTGSLIAASGWYGGLMSGASESTIRTLTAFGEAIGIAFQLADDLVDITSESEQSGKTPGTDLKEGVPTLAGLIALQGTDPADARLRELLSRPIPDSAEHAEALALLRAHSALGEARQQARDWADKARACLHELPENSARDALEKTLPIGQRVLVVKSNFENGEWVGDQSEGFIHIINKGDTPEIAPPADSVNERLVLTGYWVPMEKGFDFDAYNFNAKYGNFEPDYLSVTQESYVPHIFDAGNKALDSQVGATPICSTLALDYQIDFFYKQVSAFRNDEEENRLWWIERNKPRNCRDGDGDGICYER
jgi:geranylgeranyl pyrophosphate synthase